MRYHEGVSLLYNYYHCYYILLLLLLLITILWYYDDDYEYDMMMMIMNMIMIIVTEISMIIIVEYQGCLVHPSIPGLRLRSSSERPQVSSTVLRCLETSGCDGHFLDSCLQKARNRGCWIMLNICWPWDSLKIWEDDGTWSTWCCCDVVLELIADWPVACWDVNSTDRPCHGKTMLLGVHLPLSPQKLLGIAQSRTCYG